MCPCLWCVDVVNALWDNNEERIGVQCDVETREDSEAALLRVFKTGCVRRHTAAGSLARLVAKDRDADMVFGRDIGGIDKD